MTTTTSSGSMTSSSMTSSGSMSSTPSAQLGGRKRKGNGHKNNCGCPICKNMRKGKSKHGGDDTASDIEMGPTPVTETDIEMGNVNEYKVGNDDKVGGKKKRHGGKTKRHSKRHSKRKHRHSKKNRKGSKRH